MTNEPTREPRRATAILLAAMLLLSACSEARVAVPNSERDGWWSSACDGSGWMVCTGSGPVRETCTMTRLGSRVWRPRDCAWERFDPEYPERGGARVPYAEKLPW